MILWETASKCYEKQVIYVIIIRLYPKGNLHTEFRPFRFIRLYMSTSAEQLTFSFNCKFRVGNVILPDLLKGSLKCHKRRYVPCMSEA